MDLQTQISNIAALQDYFLAELPARGLTSTTLAQNKQRLQTFVTWLGGRAPSPLTAKLFLAELRQRGYKPSSVHSYYHAIKPFLEFLGIPFKLKLKRHKRLPRYHSTQQITSILDAIAARKGRHAKLNNRDTLLITFLALTGMRKAELLNLRLSDIQNGTIYIRNGKGDKDRAIPLAQALVRPLAEYIQQENLKPTDGLCPIRSRRLNGIVKKFSHAVGIDDLTPHGLRHYFATALLEEGALIKAIQELLGHEDISTTAIYLDVIPRHLRGSIDLLDQAFTAERRQHGTNLG